MLKMRFSRVGKKGYPIYRIVIQEHTLPTSGLSVARLGSYDPHTKKLALDKDEALAWLNKGAQPSNSVAKLLKKEGVKHKSIVIQTFRAISKKELEEKRVEAEREREAHKAELEEKLEEQKEVIAEQKAEAVEQENATAESSEEAAATPETAAADPSVAKADPQAEASAHGAPEDNEKKGE